MKHQHNDLFESAYFEKLSPEAQGEFEIRKLNDPQLAADYEDFCATMDALDTLDFQKDVTRVISQESKPRIPFKPLAWLAGAAAVVLLLVYSGVFTKKTTWDVNKDLVEFPDLHTFRNDVVEENEQLRQVLSYYNSKDYTQVISTLNSSAFDNDTLSMYLGFAYLKTQAYEKALAAINTVDSPSLTEEVNYYSGVLLYLMGKPKEAQHYWQQLPASSQYLKNLPTNAETQ